MRFKPVIVQLVVPATVVLFKKTPSTYKLTEVPDDEPHVPEMEAVAVVMGDVVMTGATEVPTPVYWQSDK